MSDRRPDMPRLLWAEVCARRLDRHGLTAPARDAQPADVVGAMCGAHAQIISAGELSVGLRLVGATRADVRAALWTEHSLIKTCGPRGTVHLLPARDLAMWTGALSAIPPRRSQQAMDQELTQGQTDEVVAAIAESLEDAELTVDELTQALVDALGAWAGELVMPAFQGLWPRWRYAMDTAANRGALCFGPNRGRNVTYTNPARWLPGFRPAEGQAALVELTKRYLYAYGPATPQQFARWLNATPRWAAELFDSLGGELERVELEGAPAWVVTGDTEAPAAATDTVRLLPYFDAYAVGCYPRELLFPGRAAERARWPVVRPATSRCCSSMGSWPASGISVAPASRSPSPWSR